MIKGVVCMASINSIWGSSYQNNSSFALQNLQSTSKTGSGNLLGIDLAEYSSVTKGSYNKLIKAYYKKYGSDQSKTENAEDAKAAKVTRTSLKGEADALNKAADALVTTGKDSLFQKVELKDEKTGETKTDYDKEKLYKAVDNLVSSYNKVVKDSTKSDDRSVLRKTLGMVRSASSNGKLLNDIGIKINSDNTLSIDEEAFKKADINTVKTLFNGEGSFGDKIQSTADTIEKSMSNALGNSRMYTASGTSARYSTGDLLDSMF